MVYVATALDRQMQCENIVLETLLDHRQLLNIQNFQQSTLYLYCSCFNNKFYESNSTQNNLAYWQLLGSSMELIILRKHARLDFQVRYLLENE